jgi:hypothetical protein
MLSPNLEKIGFGFGAHTYAGVVPGTNGISKKQTALI